MKIGLIGLQNSGKTTIFNALTKSNAEVTAYSNAKGEPNLAMVEVGDERITRLTEIYQPKKTVLATIELIDFVGVTAGSAKEGLFSSDMMQLIKNADALALVVRNFEDDLNGPPSPLEDIEQIEIELLLSDLILVEKRLDRIEQSYRRGLKSNALQIEERVLRRILDQLNKNLPIRELAFDEGEAKAIRGYQYLTSKPLLIILNSGEANFSRNQAVLEAIGKKSRAIEFAGNFEMELSQLEDEAEAKMFMEDMGITESARDRLTQFAYEMLGYISFFTVGPDEVRAWNLHKGETAVDAAGTIHSDLARGFIRAECFTYDDLIKFGSEKGIRDNGKFRLEGKDYLVKDGDILNIRFNV
jgi:GTP-binding protein YchF